jgi:hypothetical protein
VVIKQYCPLRLGNAFYGAVLSTAVVVIIIIIIIIIVTDDSDRVV